jgi:hypothetical protein
VVDVVGLGFVLGLLLEVSVWLVVGFVLVFGVLGAGGLFFCVVGLVGFVGLFGGFFGGLFGVSGRWGFGKGVVWSWLFGGCCV